MPLSEEILISADASTEDRVGHDAAFGGNATSRQGNDKGDAAENAPAKQVANELGGILDHACFMGDAKAVQQIPRGREDGNQDPETINPASQGLPEIGLKHGPIGQPTIDLRRLDWS